ncbi:MAG: hypothetical protein UIC64_09150 [Agathobacter sp.]|nr:hypothetical protein [Agathobacter sp.]
MEILQTLKIIDTVVSIAKPIIETVAPKLQESMKGFAERMLVLAEKYPSIAEFAQMIDKAADIMGDILFALGINADPVDELGAKIAQADKGVDDFESIEAYITYLKNEIELDKEKFEALSEEERVAYTITGMAVEAGAIGEKLGIEIPADVVEIVAKVAEIGKVVVDAKELISLIGNLKDEGIVNLNDVCDCIRGTGDSDRLKTGEVLVKVLDALKPNEGKDVLNEIIDEVRE